MLWLFVAQQSALDVKPIHLKVLNLTKNAPVLDTLQAEVVTFTGDGGVKVVDTVEVYGGGTLYVPPAVHILAFNVLYEGEVFPSNVVVVGRDTLAELFVYDITYDTSVVKLLSENIGILRDRGGYRVVEVFFVFNNSKYAYRGPSVRVKVPRYATALSLTTGDEDILRQGEEVILNPLVLPGEGNFALSYVIPKDYFSVSREGAGDYKLLVDTLTPIVVKYALYRGTEEFEGERIRVWEGKHRIAFYVGVPPLKREMVYYGLALLFVLFGAVLVGLLYLPPRRRKG